MATKLFDGNDLNVTKFYGGIERGECYQFTPIAPDAEGCWYSCLTRPELEELVAVLQAELAK